MDRRPAAAEGIREEPARTAGPPQRPPPRHAVHQIQRTAGNRAVRRALQRRARRAVPLEPAEVEAEGAVASTPAVDRVLATSGWPLDPGLRSRLEPRFGADLGAVRVHTGPEADAAAGSVEADAFAVGSDIVFAEGTFAPDRTEGRQLITHELTHVAQQARSGVSAVQRQPSPGPVVQADDDAEADRQMVALQASQPGILTLNNAVRWGGLAGWRARLPLSYPEMRRRAVVQYGGQAIAWLESHDVEVQALVSKSEAVQARLLEQRDYWAGLGPESEAAQAVVDFYRGVDYVWGDDVRGVYEVSFSYFAEQYSNDIHFDLRLYQQIMAGDVEDLVQGVGAQAFSAAADAKTAREQRERWTEPATRSSATWSPSARASSSTTRSSSKRCSTRPTAAPTRTR